MGKTQTALLSVLPSDIREEVKKRVRLGIYASEKDAIQTALRKAYAQEAREYLKNIVKELKITEKDMLKDWGKVRG